MNFRRHLLISGIIFSLSQTGLAAPLYVDPVDGDDANDGLSWGTALKTLTRAAVFVSQHPVPAEV